ncbi:hypothetical protein B005_4818 [Nocardiopsis alba ATCC BAA-2165]|uniref:Uncharacterized protein n=1 Tax=Nocardiopsis alba (strain ATCC BAA-2165 / BE74) TaxID=1205910 RepID=J7L753_NOCAA|nr:hypothetical protein B005_4818 [Nocardiopsis alba ATCC BAA-2165]
MSGFPSFGRTGPNKRYHRNLPTTIDVGGGWKAGRMNTDDEQRDHGLSRVPPVVDGDGGFEGEED